MFLSFNRTDCSLVAITALLLSHTTRIWHTSDEARAFWAQTREVSQAQRRAFTAGVPEWWHRFRLSIGQRTPKKIVQKGSVQVDRR